MVGPGLEEPGGIAAVASTWLATRAIEQVEVSYHPSMGVGSAWRKAQLATLGQARFVGRLAAGWRPQVLHLHSSAFTSFYRKLLYFHEGRAARLPVIVHVHGSRFEVFHDASPLHRRAVERTFERAAAVVVLSEATARVVRGWLGGRGDVRVIYNPVHIGPDVTPRRSLERPPTVLFMGLLGRRKGAYDLVEAFAEVARRVPRARLVMGGNGEVEQVRRAFEERGLADRVELLGWVDGHRKAQAFVDADVYCLPSYNEGLPMSILEAMAASLPVVSTPVAGIPEAVVEGVTGHLVSPGDVAGLADRLAGLLADPGRRMAWGAASRRLAVERFDAEVVVQQAVDLWREKAGVV